MPKFIDLTGQKFGRLIVVKRVVNSKWNEVQWQCNCICGNKPIVKSGALKRKNRPTRSCGCLNKEGNSAKSRNLGEIKRSLLRREELKDLFPLEWNDLPTTRKTAQDSEPYSTTYFNATYCEHNHLERQYTHTGRCVACALIDQRKKDKCIKEIRANEIIENNEFRICPECDIPFLMIPNYQQDKKFCSKKCSGAESRRNWAIKNPEKKREVANAYTAKIISEGGERYEKMKKRSAASHAKRYKSDPAFRLRQNYGTRLRNFLKYQRQGKSFPTLEYLGCEVDEFADFIEKQFTPIMNWENYEQFGWHLDHIRPCESFDFNDINQAFTCFNWRNFKPLWWDKNIAKGDTYEPNDEIAWVERMCNLDYEGELYLLYE